MRPARRGGASIFARFAKTYSVLFGSAALVVLIAFVPLRMHHLSEAQHASASAFLANLLGVIEESTAEELDSRVSLFLRSLPSRLLFECLHLRLPALEREYYWPTAECDTRSTRNPQLLDMPVRRDSQTLRLEVAYTLDGEAANTQIADELAALAVAALALIVIAIIALSMAFRRHIYAPVAQLRRDLVEADSSASGSATDSTPMPAEFADIARAYETLLEREKALQRESAFRRALRDQAFDCIVSIDSQGTIIDFNARAERTFAMSRQDAIGRSLAETIIPHRYRDAHRAGFRRHLETGETRVIGKRIRIEALHSDGSEIPVELIVTKVEVGGEPMFTAYLRDIRQDLERERELEHAKELAEKASRAKTEFLATMSHEIRSPLNAMMGSIDILSGTKLESTQRQYVELAADSGTVLLSLIDDILDMSRIEAGHLNLAHTPFSLHKIVQDTKNLLTARASEKNLSLRAVFGEGLPTTVTGDRGRIRQILINLAGNAIKFTEHGSVTLGVERLEHGDRYRFRVEDTGIGIEPELLANVFEPFRQLDSGFTRLHEGSGLGLSISKRLVEAMDGSIGCDSTPGKGSRFWFELELAAGEHAETDAASLPPPTSADTAATAAGHPTPRRALVAEDSAANRRVLQTFLSAGGFEVDTVTDGHEVLDAVAASDYDIILMDVSMPGMDGIEATRRLRSLPGKGRTVPIVALTAHALEDVRAQCLSAGMDAFLTKPVSKSALLRVVGQYLERRRDPEGDSAH